MCLNSLERVSGRILQGPHCWNLIVKGIHRLLFLVKRIRSFRKNKKDEVFDILMWTGSNFRIEGDYIFSVLV